MQELVAKIESIIIATVLGAIIGYTRERLNKNAGLKTNSIVALAASLLVSASLNYGDEGIMRMAAQIVSGVGFLGAGIILVKTNKGEDEHVKVQGLTSAATVWFSASIGIVTPLKDGIALAIIATVIYLFIILFFGKVEQKLIRNDENEE